MYGNIGFTRGKRRTEKPLTPHQVKRLKRLRGKSSELHARFMNMPENTSDGVLDAMEFEIAQIENEIQSIYAE